MYNKKFVLKDLNCQGFVFHSLEVSKRRLMSLKLSSSESWNLSASVTSEFVNVAITKLILRRKTADEIVN